MRRRVSWRILAIVLIAPTALVAAPAAAAPEAGAEDATYREAQSQYDQGRGKFETADYDAAIELWTQAYTTLPATPKYAKIKVLLLYDLASAREQAFEVDNSVQQLRQARILLENFEQSIPGIYGDGAAADRERARVQERLAVLDEKIDAAKAEGLDDPPPAKPVKDTPPPDPVVVVPSDAPAGSGGRSLIITGAVLTGLGVAGLGVMAAGLGMGNAANDISDLAEDDFDGRRKQFDRGRTGNTLAIAGGIGGGVLLATGAALLIVGARKNSARTAWMPAGGKGWAGLGVAGRF